VDGVRAAAAAVVVAVSVVNCLVWLYAQLDDDERVARAAGAGADRPEAGVWTRECGHVDFDDNDLPPGHGECCVVGGDIQLYDEGGHSGDQAEHIARHDPAAVLAQVAAARALLALYERAEAWLHMRTLVGPDRDVAQGRRDAAADAVRIIAAGYRDRDGYRPEWAVES
jgi:hypothetical protein